MANRIDSLTGLHNRRYFDEIIKKECERADRYQRPTSLIMLDLDYFKKVNDNFGHQTGDLVLQSLGKIMLELVRLSDTPCRYGGEEFAIILPETGLFEAQRIAERIRRVTEAVMEGASEGARQHAESAGNAFEEALGGIS